MKKILITGEIGSGKSLFSKLLRSRGYKIYDCDTKAKDLYREKKELLEKISSVFGKEILDEKGFINKKALADLIFSNPQNIEILENLLFPYLIEDIKLWQKKHSKEDFLFIESATALEKDCFKSLIDKVIALKADESLRMQRVAKRSNLSEEEFRQRNEKQRIDPAKVDFWIENNGNEKDLEQSAENLIFFLSL